MRWLSLLLFAAVSLTQAGCGNGNREASVEADQPNPPVSVNIIESSVTVEVATTFQFHFDVSNATYPTCAWTVNEVAGGNSAFGTITDEGLYTAPATIPTPNKVTVRATATADTSKSDTAIITIKPKLTILPATPTARTRVANRLSSRRTKINPKSTDLPKQTQ